MTGPTIHFPTEADGELRLGNYEVPRLKRRFASGVVVEARAGYPDALWVTIEDGPLGPGEDLDPDPTQRAYRIRVRTIDDRTIERIGDAFVRLQSEFQAVGMLGPDERRSIEYPDDPL